MANIGELGVGLKIDEGSLLKATKKVQNEFKNAGDSIENNFTKKTKQGFSSLTSGLAGLGSMLGSIFGIGAIVGFTKQLLSLGSDLEEIGSKFNVVFKGSQEVKQSFDNLAQATNRSSLDLMTFGSGIGNVLAPLDLAQKEVDAMSVSITQLAIDVASFNNVSDQQAITAFTSALTGEREALKSLGIVIKETDVQQKAYELGLVKQGQELTKQQTALATYQLLLDNTANAQGDATRTAGSFANQLKGLRGAIKDTFANAGKDVAGATSGILGTLSTFISSYGKGIFQTIINSGKLVVGELFKLGNALGNLFGLLRTGTTEGGNNLQNFAWAFQKVVQGFGVGVKTISLIITSLVEFMGFQLDVIVKLWSAGLNSISDLRNILKTGIVGTFKTIVDVAGLGVDLIAQVFVGMAEGVIGVFKGLADNIGVAIKKSVNVALKGINGFIELVNNIPGVNIEKLVPLGDADRKPIVLGVNKNIEKLKQTFSNFGSDVVGNYAGIGASFGNISSNFKGAITSIVADSKQSFNKIGNDRQTFGGEVITQNNQITKSLTDGAKAQEDNSKKVASGFFNVLDAVNQYKGGVDKGKEAQKQANEVAKQSIDTIKKGYNERKKLIDDTNDKEKKLAEDTIKYNTDIKDSIRAIGKELETTAEKYTTEINKINQETNLSVAERSVEVAKDLAETEKNIADIKAESAMDETEKKTKIEEIQNKIAVLQLKISENTSKTNKSTKESQILALNKYNSQLKVLETEGISIENQDKLKELEAEKTRLLQEQQFIIQNTTAEQRAEAERVAGLSEAERIKEEGNAKVAQQQLEFDAERKKLESLQRINETFLNLKSLNQNQLDKLLQDERIKAMSQEEQELILKLAREKIQLTNQTNEIIAQQQQIKDATVQLSNEATAIQMANITALKTEYGTLINEINNAIIAQRKLNEIKNQSTLPGLSTGGFTGQGGTNEVAGLVHKGERVAPKRMVNSMKPMFDNLENMRGRGYADGGFTNNTNKTQNNNITVNSGVDLRAFIDYAKWKL